MAEAVRLRLDALVQHGCYRSLDRAALRAELMAVLPPATEGEQPHLYVEPARGTVVLVGHPDMTSPWVALYGWRNGKIRSLVVVHGTASGSADWQVAMRTQLLPLDYAVFQPTGAAQPLLAMVSTHPWTSSCWRTLRFRVLAPTGDPFRPRVLLDHEGGGRWCETPRVSVEGDIVHFDYFDWGGPWTMATVWRPYRMTYQYQQARLTERFGFVSASEARLLFTYLVEDWLYRPWALAEQATLPTARGQLKAVHERLRDQLRAKSGETAGGDSGEYTTEVFPSSPTRRRVAFYCATDAKTPCPRWPRPVDFFVERQGELWLIADVKPR